MDLFPRYGTAIKKFLVRLVGIAMLAIVVGLIWAKGTAPPVLPLQNDEYVHITLQYVCVPMGDFIVADEHEESVYKGEFKDCFIVNTISEGKNVYLVNPFAGFDLNRLDGLHEMTSFPIFTVSQAEALSKAKQGIIKTEGRVQLYEVELAVPVELWGEFTKGFVKEENKTDDRPTFQEQDI